MPGRGSHCVPPHNPFLHLHDSWCSTVHLYVTHKLSFHITFRSFHSWIKEWGWKEERAEVCPYLCGVALPVQLCSWSSPSGFHLFLSWFFLYDLFFLVLINAVLPFTCTQCATEVTFLSQCFDHDTFLCNLYLVPCVHFKNKFLYTSWKLSKLHLPLVHCSLERDWFHPSLPIFQMFRQKLCSSLTFCPHLSPCSQTCACIVTAAHGKSGE